MVIQPCISMILIFMSKCKCIYPVPLQSIRSFVAVVVVVVVVVVFKFSVGIVVFSCFFFGFLDVSLTSSFFNHCSVLLFWLTSSTHIPLQNVTQSRLPGFMSLLLFSFSKSFKQICSVCPKHSGNCSVLALYLVNLIHVDTTLCFCSSVITFNLLSSTVYLFFIFPFFPLLFPDKALSFSIDLNG